MEFELNPELIDQIIFGMENQDNNYFVDAEEQVVVPDNELEEEIEDDERYYGVPEWTSVHGFQLMEKFVSSLRNPIAREELRQSLAGGRGVFRNFKNALHQHLDVEKLWFSFKDKEMRRFVVDWYNDLSEVWGISKIALHEEETEELVLSDFIISRLELSGQVEETIGTIDGLAYEEVYAGYPQSWIDERIDRDRSEYDPAHAVVLCAETPAGELAGVLRSHEEEYPDDDGSVIFGTIRQLYVIPEYRGLGVSKTLMLEYCNGAYDRGVARVVIVCPAAALGYGDRLELEGFVEVSRTYELDVDRWKRENTGG